MRNSGEESLAFHSVEDAVAISNYRLCVVLVDGAVIMRFLLLAAGLGARLTAAARHMHRRMTNTSRIIIIRTPFLIKPGLMCISLCTCPFSSPSSPFLRYKGYDNAWSRCRFCFRWIAFIRV